MIFKQYLLALLALIPLAATAQPLQFEWLVEYPCFGPSSLEYDKIITDEAENVYLCGAAPSPTMNSFYSSAILTQQYDSTGSLIWESFFDGRYSDRFRESRLKGNHSFIVGGTRGSLPGSLPNRAELVNYDLVTGEELWHKFIFDTVQQAASLEDFDLDSEGNIYAFGIVNNYPSEYDSNKMFVAKILSANGEIVWSNIFQEEFNATKGKIMDDRIRIYGGKFLGAFDYTAIILDVDFKGNIISSVNLPNIQYGPGIFSSYFFFENEGYLIGFGYQITKFGLSTTPEWAFDFSRGLPNMIGQAKTATHDETGNIYATGYIKDTVHQQEYTQTVKLSPNGELLWATVDTFDLSTRFERGEVIAVSQHHVFACSEAWYYNDANEVVNVDYRPILYSNESGEILHDTLIDGNQFDITYDAHYGKGHFYLLGRSFLPGGTADDYRYKLFKFGVEEPSAVGDMPNGEGGLEVFPNPFDASTTIELKGIESNSAMTFKLLDITGRTVQEGAFRSPSLTLQREQLPSGLYFIKVETEDGRPAATGRVVAK